VPKPLSLWLRGVVVLAGAVVLSALSACETPPAFAVPPGQSKSVDVDVTLPVYVVGNWAVRSFVDALVIELAKYHVNLASPGSPVADGRFQIDLGQVTYRDWQTIEVSRLRAGETAHVGSIRLSDVGVLTIEASAQPAAALIAAQVWGRATVP
jgi:hypothetical protein